VGGENNIWSDEMKYMPPYSPQVNNILEKAVAEAFSKHETYVTLQDLLVAIFKDMDKVQRLSRIRATKLDFGIEL
jgi:ATP-dependent Clp protease ATP-binding subunit ClpA